MAEKREMTFEEALTRHSCQYPDTGWKVIRAAHARALREKEAEVWEAAAKVVDEIPVGDRGVKTKQDADMWVKGYNATRVALEEEFEQRAREAKEGK